jgi:group II intron reverse transcriptase/maturase/CRISPR-associated endonuclease Cas1
MEVFEQLCRIDTLRRAWQKVRRKNARGGIDGVNPEDLDNKIEKVLADLSRSIETQTYAPAPMERVKVPKFNPANEWRPLSMPVVIDKIAQQALVDIIGPVLEKTFLDVSYAYRPEKGAVRAIRRIEHILTANKARWAAPGDIDNFFDSLNRDILLQRLTETIGDERAVRLVRLWLEAGMITSKGGYLDPDEGIAQGAVISPLLSNLYLHPLDACAVEKGLGYVRYSDNFIVLSENREKAYAGFEAVEAFLKEKLMLRLNSPGLNPVKGLENGFVFLGIYFKGTWRAMSREKELKNLKKLNWMTNWTTPVPPGIFLEKLRDHVGSQKRYYNFIHPKRQFAQFDAYLEKRLPGLASGFVRKKLLEPGKGVQDFLARVEFYSDQTADERQALIRRIAEAAGALLEPKPQPATASKAGETAGAEVVKTEGQEENKAEADAKPSQADAAAGRRSRAVKNRYLRKAAEVSEIVVNTPGIFIGKTGERIVLRKERKNIQEVPFSRVRQISVASSGVALSSDLVRWCSQRSVVMAFLDAKGSAYASLHTPLYCRGDLSVSQSRMHQGPRAFYVARRILEGKCRNQVNVVKFYSRHRLKADPHFAGCIGEALESMEKGVADLKEMKPDGEFEKVRDHLFTAEARIASRYWGIVKLLLPKELGFEKREKKGAADVVNNMLNYGYGVLYQRVWMAAASAGLNPNISFLHGFQKDKPALIYDLVEEYRQALVDRPLFSIMTRGTRYRSFKLDPKTGLLDHSTRETALTTVLGRLSTLVNYRGRKITAEEVIRTQVRQIADFVSEKRTNYRPFITSY